MVEINNGGRTPGEIAKDNAAMNRQAAEFRLARAQGRPANAWGVVKAEAGRRSDAQVAGEGALMNDQARNIRLARQVGTANGTSQPGAEGKR